MTQSVLTGTVFALFECVACRKIRCKFQLEAGKRSASGILVGVKLQRLFRTVQPTVPQAQYFFKLPHGAISSSFISSNTWHGFSHKNVRLIVYVDLV